MTKWALNMAYCELAHTALPPSSTRGTSARKLLTAAWLSWRRGPSWIIHQPFSISSLSPWGTQISITLPHTACPFSFPQTSGEWHRLMDKQTHRALGTLSRGSESGGQKKHLPSNHMDEQLYYTHTPAAQIVQDEFYWSWCKILVHITGRYRNCRQINILCKTRQSAKTAHIVQAVNKKIPFHKS